MLHNNSQRPTLVVGASTDPQRYAYLAAVRLVQHGHPITLFGLRKGEVAGASILTEWPAHQHFHTVTMYVGPTRQPALYQNIIDLKPERVIFNPGTENPEFYAKLNEAGIPFEEACTLVLLGTEQY